MAFPPGKTDNADGKPSPSNLMASRLDDRSDRRHPVRQGKKSGVAIAFRIEVHQHN
jgi:hypothetical protein